MTDARTKTPTNTNFVESQNFKFIIKKTPTINYFVQNVNVPGISLDNVEEPNPFVKIPHSGDHIMYDDLMINFKVNEDLSNYLEIHNWIKRIGFPKTFESYDNEANTSILHNTSGEGEYSDMTIMVLTSHRNPSFEIVFRKAFPVSLSSIIFDSTMPDASYLEAAATFRYTYYDILPIGAIETDVDGDLT